MKEFFIAIICTLCIFSVGCKKPQKTTIEKKEEETTRAIKENEESFKNDSLEIVKKFKKIQSEEEKDPSKIEIAATVDNEKINKWEVEFVLESRYIGKDLTKLSEESKQKEKDDILNTMIQKAAAVSFARKNNLFPTDEVIHAATGKLKENVKNDEYEAKKAKEVMKVTSWNMDEYVNSYKKDIEEAFAIENLYKYYKENYESKEDNKLTFSEFLKELTSKSKVEKNDLH